MARARTAKHPKPVEPEEESQETPDSDYALPGKPIPNPKDEPPSKAEAVRRAMADGLSKPGDIQQHVKAHYGLDIPKPQISSYAAQQRAREGKSGGDSSRVASPMQSTGIPASFGDDVKQIKGLIEKLGGGDEVKELSNTLTSLNQKYGRAGLDSLIDALE